MKILFLHNYYRYLGGEDLSFDSEVDLLRTHGHEVIPITRDNQDLHATAGGPVRLAAQTIWNRRAARDISRAIATHRPDVMHCNNLFPQFSSAVYGPARAAGVPIVQALRNYRYFCANSVFFRDGKLCTDCLGRSCATGGIRHACYRDSRVASGVVAAMQFTHRHMGTWANAVDLYFTPSAYARDVYIRGGFDPEQVAVKPNFIDPDPGFCPTGGDDALFVGRLSVEKGLSVVLEAWKQMPDAPRLQIIGDGPLRGSVEAACREQPGLDYLGPLPHAEILRRLGHARFLVMPSLWYETFGRTIVEAFSRGTPVIASRMGAMSELVRDNRNGRLFHAGDASDLAVQVRQMMRGDTTAMRRAARQSYLDHYTAAATYQRLLDIYQTAQHRRSRRESIAESLPHRVRDWWRPTTWASTWWGSPS